MNVLFDQCYLFSITLKTNDMKIFLNARTFSISLLLLICFSAFFAFQAFAVEGDAKELIMVSSTGTVQNDGTLKSKNGGLYDKIVNGHQFAKTGRKYSWPAQMKL